ncbi:MAG: phosphatase PAP2 family protein [Pseudomonadota bacterium]
MAETHESVETAVRAPRWSKPLRRIGLVAFLALLLFVSSVSKFDPEKMGDNHQIFLPLLGFGCAIAEGQGLRYFGRYLLLETLIKGPKFALGDHPINIRPTGGDQGFPSGHTAAAAFGATALVQTCLKDSRWAQGAAIVTAGFVGSSRIEAGKHTIWQVLAGALVGWLSQALALVGFDRGIRRVWFGARPLALRVWRRGYAALMAGEVPEDRGR